MNVLGDRNPLSLKVISSFEEVESPCAFVIDRLEHRSFLEPNVTNDTSNAGGTEKDLASTWLGHRLDIHILIPPPIGIRTTRTTPTSS
jgi:hypothetical protein